MASEGDVGRCKVAGSRGKLAAGVGLVDLALALAADLLLTRVLHVAPLIAVCADGPMVLGFAAGLSAKTGCLFQSVVGVMATCVMNCYFCVRAFDTLLGV